MPSRFKPFRMLLCLFGRHRRSRGHAYDNGAQLMSVCRHCGIGMKRVQGKWMVDLDELGERPAG